jgi:2-haloacid dehalogenase
MSSHTAFADIGGCLFDAYGTLFNVHAPVDRLAGRLGPDAAAVSALWRQKQVQYTWLRSLMNAYVPFSQITEEALDHALAAYRVKDAEIRGELLNLYRTLDAYPEVPESLRRLRSKGLTTGILSNGNPDMVQAAATAAGIRGSLEYILSADEVGIFKPDSRVYQLGVETLSLPAERICFVSSNAWDVAGAAHFGFTVVWVNRFDQYPEHLPGAPVAQVRSLDEVADLVLGQASN